MVMLGNNVFKNKENYKQRYIFPTETVTVSVTIHRLIAIHLHFFSKEKGQNETKRRKG